MLILNIIGMNVIIIKFTINNISISLIISNVGNWWSGLSLVCYSGSLRSCLRSAVFYGRNAMETGNDSLEGWWIVSSPTDWERHNKVRIESAPKNRCPLYCNTSDSFTLEPCTVESPCSWPRETGRRSPLRDRNPQSPSYPHCPEVYSLV